MEDHILPTVPGTGFDGNAQAGEVRLDLAVTAHPVALKDERPLQPAEGHRGELQRCDPGDGLRAENEAADLQPTVW